MNQEPQHSDFATRGLPFLKWPGGKRWAATQISQVIRRHLLNCYYEPFVGGGAVFFNLHPPRAVLSDLNGDLISTYKAVSDDHTRILRYLKKMEVTSDFYNAVRASSPSGRFLRAARFLYLNRTAFGGIYRVNRQGQFNVPFGGERTPNILWEEGLLRSAARVLQSAELETSDFEPMLDRAVQGDVVYCDPTYTVAHENNGFIRYNEANFSWNDQERLALAAHRARRRGARVIVTNAFHRDVEHLYKAANAKILTRPSLVSPNAAARRIVREYLFFF